MRLVTAMPMLVSRHCGSALAYAPEFQDDREVVEAAVQRNGCSLRYAMAYLREATWIKDGLVGHKSFSGWQVGGFICFASLSKINDAGFRSVVPQVLRSNFPKSTLQNCNDLDLSYVRRTGICLFDYILKNMMKIYIWHFIFVHVCFCDIVYVYICMRVRMPWGMFWTQLHICLFLSGMRFSMFIPVSRAFR